MEIYFKRKDIKRDRIALIGPVFNWGYDDCKLAITVYFFFFALFIKI